MSYLNKQHIKSIKLNKKNAWPCKTHSHKVVCYKIAKVLWAGLLACYYAVTRVVKNTLYNSLSFRPLQY